MDVFRRAATDVDRILHGAKPAAPTDQLARPARYAPGAPRSLAGAFSWSEAGFRTERENLAGDAKGKSTSGSNREAESTDAPARGGLPRSSDEVAESLPRSGPPGNGPASGVAEALTVEGIA